jgi:general secretion pathway protein F
MARFQYRAVTGNGETSSGVLDAADRTQAIASIRRMGAMPVSLVAANDSGALPAQKSSAKAQAAARLIIGELAVLLNAGLQVDRALALAIDNVEEPKVGLLFADMLRDVREGVPLFRAMARKADLFGTTAVAMTEAGEANGKLGDALARLSDMLETAADLRRTVSSAMLYPIILTFLAVAVILLMLLFVIPQFESLFASSKAPLPPASRFVMGASRFLRDHGLLLLGAAVAAIVGLRYLMSRPSVRKQFDAFVLRLPQLSELIRRVETARFARTLGALIEGNVALPAAFALAQRTIGNSVMAAAISKVSGGIREGGGLSAPLAAAGILPKLAIGFFRTGEESSQLGTMLTRLADVLDRDIRVRLERVIGILTPLITIILGMSVAGIIASVMSAILGFNELAVAQ